MKPVELTEVTTTNCVPCEAFEKFWHSIEKDWPNVTFRSVDVTTAEGQVLAQKHMILAAPGIIVNGELLSSGGFDKDQLLNKIKELSQ